MSGPKHLWSGDWERDSEASTQELDAQRKAASEPGPATQPPTPPGPNRKRALALAAVAAVLVAGVAVALVTLLGPSGHHSTTPTVASAPPATQTAPTAPRAPAPTTPAPIPIPPVTIPTVPHMIPAPQPTHPAPQPTTPTPQPSPAPTTPAPQPSPTPQPTPTPAPTIDTRTVTWLGMQINTVAGVAVIETVRPGSAGDRAGLEPGYTILSVSGKTINSAVDVADAVKGLQPGTRVQLEIGYGSLLKQTTIVLGAPPVVHQ